METKDVTKHDKSLNVFERYLTIWVILCIVGGIVLGKMYGFYEIILEKHYGKGETF